MDLSFLEILSFMPPKPGEAKIENLKISPKMLIYLHEKRYSLNNNPPF